jgi:hypothetical protein
VCASQSTGILCEAETRRRKPCKPPRQQAHAAETQKRTSEDKVGSNGLAGLRRAGATPSSAPQSTTVFAVQRGPAPARVPLAAATSSERVLAK